MTCFSGQVAYLWICLDAGRFLFINFEQTLHWGRGIARRMHSHFSRESRNVIRPPHSRVAPEEPFDYLSYQAKCFP